MIDKRLLNEMPQAKKYIVKQVFMQWLSLLSNVGMIMMFSFVFVRLFQNQFTKRLFLFMIFFVVIMIGIRVICTKKASDFSYKASCDVKNHLRTKIYKKLLKLKNNYTTYISTSELIQLSVEGVDQLETYFGKYLPQFFYSMLAPITLFLILMWFDWRSSLVLLICVPLIPVSIVAVQKFAKKLLSKYWDKYTKLGDSFLENLQGLTTLKIYQSDAFKNEEMNREAEDFRKITMKVLTMQLNSISVMDLVAYGGAAIGSCFAIVNFFQGNVSLFGVLCIVLLSSEFFIPLRLLGSFFHIAMNGMAASNKIFHLFDIAEDESKKETFSEKEISIHISNLDFSYDGKRKVLNQIQLHVLPHQFVSIVGESGSGKSTIAKLISGLAQGYDGNLQLQDIERNHLDDQSFYQRVMYITHKPILFKGTIRHNLSIAGENITEEDMWKVLHQVKLADFIQKVGGLDYLLEEEGNNLSGGQKQRLSLARALLADKEMYIFDEATSNVDMESENAILEVIQKMSTSKTIIMISHRLSTVVKSDCIYVLDQGKVDAQGTHEQLMAQKGLYYKLFTHQQQLEQFYEEGVENETR